MKSEPSSSAVGDVKLEEERGAYKAQILEEHGEIRGMLPPKGTPMVVDDALRKRAPASGA